MGSLWWSSYKEMTMDFQELRIVVINHIVDVAVLIVYYSWNLYPYFSKVKKKTSKHIL
jgi:hypothetical protein